MPKRKCTNKNLIEKKIQKYKNKKTSINLLPSSSSLTLFVSMETLDWRLPDFVVHLRKPVNPARLVLSHRQSRMPHWHRHVSLPMLRNCARSFWSWSTRNVLMLRWVEFTQYSHIPSIKLYMLYKKGLLFFLFFNLLR